PPRCSEGQVRPDERLPAQPEHRAVCLTARSKRPGRATRVPAGRFAGLRGWTETMHGMSSAAASVSDFLRFSPRRELLLGAAVTAVFAAVVLAVGPAPGDAPVHLYRTFLVRDGALVWDNFWYSGTYPLASYS